MKNKIAILIITSVLALVSLSAIQAYLINNTYQLKKDAFIQETKDALEGLTTNKEIESLNGIWQENLKNLLNDYKSGRISKAEVLNSFFTGAVSLNSMSDSLFQKELKQANLGYDVKFKKNLVHIIISEGANIDSVFVANKSAQKLFGHDFDNENGNEANLNTWFSENEFIHFVDGAIRTNTYDLEVKTQNLILIQDWKRIVYGRMAGLFFGSVLLFLFVIGLLYYSIKNLVTQKKIAEIKTDFINNITHELKTPLATLSIATKSLKNEGIKKNPEAFENTLNIVERQNERLQKLIDQVMNNSLSNEEIVLNKEQVVDNTYFNNLIEDFKLSTQHQNLVIKNEISKGEVLLRLDKFHFATAVLNIMENAVKYGNGQTQIILKTELKNGDYFISIRDNGIGISEKNQKQIFDKFYRVNDGNVHNVKGLGLGLYYTGQIVKAHKGSISIESELENGTIFNIKIPVN